MSNSVMVEVEAPHREVAEMFTWSINSSVDVPLAIREDRIQTSH